MMRMPELFVVSIVIVCNVVGVLGISGRFAGESGMPTMDVPECPGRLPPRNESWAGLSAFAHAPGPFALADGSGPAVQPTELSLCVLDGSTFVMQFWAKDDNIVSPLSGCNDALYNYSVVEMFVGPANESDPSAPLHNYLELEVSPSSALFVAHVFNPNLDCPGIVDSMVPCDESGVVYEAARTGQGWWAYLSVPFSLAGPPGTRLFRANFFRIDQPAGEEKEYSCVWPTMSNPPCFHRPDYMALLRVS